jgi:hypothetical protein
MMMLKNNLKKKGIATRLCLATETVEGASLPLEGIYYIHGSHSLATSMLGIGDRIANYVLKEDLENSTGLLIYQAGDTLNATTSSQTPDSGLGDALDIVTKHFAMTLGPTLAKALAALATSRHG